MTHPLLGATCNRFEVRLGVNVICLRFDQNEFGLFTFEQRTSNGFLSYYFCLSLHNALNIFPTLGKVVNFLTIDDSFSFSANVFWTFWLAYIQRQTSMGFPYRFL